MEFFDYARVSVWYQFDGGWFEIGILGLMEAGLSLGNANSSRDTLLV